MADLDHTLQRFQGLLLAEQPVAIGEAEDAIWAVAEDLLQQLAQGVSYAGSTVVVTVTGALARRGAQVLMATHSPVLLAVPDARIVSVLTLEPVLFRDCEPVTATQEFIDDPAGTARFRVGQ